jgi:hypothetical protein
MSGPKLLAGIDQRVAMIGWSIIAMSNADVAMLMIGSLLALVNLNRTID